MVVMRGWGVGIGRRGRVGGDRSVFDFGGVGIQGRGEGNGDR